MFSFTILKKKQAIDYGQVSDKVVDKLSRFQEDLRLCQKGIFSKEDILKIYGNEVDIKTLEESINILNCIEVINDILMIKQERAAKVFMKHLENFEKYLTLAYKNNKNIKIVRIVDRKIVTLDEMRLTYEYDPHKDKYKIISIDYFVKT